MPSSHASSSGSHSDEGEDGYGLGDLMPRSPSPEPIPFSFATYNVPEELRAAVGGKEVLTVRLVGSHPLWGHHLWNTARVTTTYLLSHPQYIRGQRVLELGAGGALPSIACALAGSSTVVPTDYADESLMANIAYNVGLNVDEHTVKRVVPVGHTWGGDVRALLAVPNGVEMDSPNGAKPVPEREDGRYDTVILSDLMFNHSQHDALIRTLDATLAVSPTASAFVFLTHHRPRLAEADMAFFPRLVASGSSSSSLPCWEYERVVEEWTGPMFQDDPGDEKVRGTVHGFRCWRTQQSTARGVEA